MTTDFDRFSRLMLDEFKRVHDRFDTVDERLETIGTRIGAAEARLISIETELRDIRQRLGVLEEATANFTGFAKEIDHVLQRVGAIEKHLGLQHSIAA